jgi:leucine dehydrogenase
VVEALLRAWDGEELVLRHDAATATFMVVAIHSTVLGPAMGGTRMKVYPTFERAVDDALRLASAMTLKQAAADLPFGGGKAVLAVPEIPARGSEGWRGLFERYGDLVEALGGRYVTAADMNTGSAELDVIGQRTAHVLGRSPALGGSGDSGADTALGVFHGIRAACAHAFGTDDLAGRSVLVQGVGAVGLRLVELLRGAAADVLIADIDPARAAEVASRTAATLVAPDEVIGTPCDVFAPCATGGVLSVDTIPALKCRVVAGAANNQLAERADADRLHDAGILYAPDHVVNAGGVIHLACYETLGWDEATVQARLARIADTLAEVFAIADRDGLNTAAAAERLAHARIDAARA